MKIVVEFNSLEEMDQFCNGVAVAPGLARNTVPMKVEEKPAIVEKPDKKKKEKPVKEETAAEPVAQETAEEVPAEEEKTYTLEDVRAKLGALQKAGRRDEVKALLQSVGAEKLPEVDPKDYGILMQKAGELDA